MPRSAALLILALASLPARAASDERPVATLPTADLSSSLREFWDKVRAPFVTGRPAVPAPGAAASARLVSWNVQKLGKSAPAAKKNALKGVLERIVAGSADPLILAAQEVANEKGAEALLRALPGGGRGWTLGFQNTPTGDDNALLFGPGVTVHCEATLPIPGVKHPPRMAHLSVGDADFTLLSVHLTYAQGDAAASAAEMAAIADWARAQAARPGVDPDFVIAGDFNLPTEAGKALSSRARERSWSPLEESVGAGFAVLVDQPTSRSGRHAVANNYDHFVVSDDFAREELVDAGVIDLQTVAAAEAAAGTRASDHLPIALAFRRAGPGRDGRPVSPDGPAICR